MKSRLVDLISIFLLSLTPLLWFRPGEMMLGHDNVFPIDPKQFLLGRLSTWVSHAFGQSQSLIMGTIPIHAIDALPFLAGFDIFTTQKIVYVFWFFMIGLSIYILARTIDKNDRIFALIAAVFYQFNFFILQGWFIGERTKFSAYIAFPLILSVFFKVYYGGLNPIRAGLLNSLILFIFNGGGLYGIPLFGGAIITILVFLSYFSLLSVWQKKKEMVFRLLATLIITVGGYVFVNAYFIVPAAKQVGVQLTSAVAESGGVGGLIDWAREISANTSLINLMRLEGIAEWYDNPEHPYAKEYLTNPILIGLSFLWPLLIILALIFVKKRLELIFFALVYLASLIFTAGTHPPFGFLYKFLLSSFPGFVIFRSPYYKFAPALFLASSFLIALLIRELRGRLKIFFGAILIFTVLAYHWPYFAGNFFSWRSNFSTRLMVPEYVSDFGHWLNNRNPADGRVLILPPNDPALQYSQYSWGYLSFQNIATLVSNYPVVINNDRLSEGERRLTGKLYKALAEDNLESAQRYLTILGISYLVYQEDAISAFKFPSMLEQPDLFEKISTFGRWVVYKQQRPVPAKVFIADHLRIIDAIESEKGIEDYSGGQPVFSKRPGSKNFYDSLDISESIVPACINCPLKNKPFIQFPDRPILPDSPLYSFIKILEERKLRGIADPKSRIYGYLGLSLKRVGEASEMIVRQVRLTKQFVDSYKFLLSEIKNNFEKVELLKDKIAIASDIKEYLRAHRNRLSPNLGVYLTRGEQTVMVGTIYSAIDQLEQFIAPFAAQYESPVERVYQFALDRPGQYLFKVRTDNLFSRDEKEKQIRISLDGNKIKDLEISQSERLRRWIEFDNNALSAGAHTLGLVISEENPVSYQLAGISTEFSVPGSNSCFGATIPDMSADTPKRIIVTYLNDFSENLLMYKWEIRSAQRRLVDAAKLFSSGLPDKKDEILKVDSYVDAIEVAFCAPTLTDEIIKKQFSMTVGNLTYPTLLLEPSSSQISGVKPIKLSYDSSTRYSAELPPNEKPFIMVFSQRFDPGWKLGGVESKHFEANGFSNAWLVDASSQPRKIVLEYIPQNYFLLGVAISAISVLLASSIIWLRRL